MKDILKSKWGKSDKELEKFLNEYKKLDYIFRDKIQNVFNDYDMTYDNMFKFADNNTKAKYNRIISQGDLKGYNGRIIQKMGKKRKVKNYDLFRCLIMYYVLQENKKLNEQIKELLEKNSQIAYKQAEKECKGLKHKKKWGLKDSWLEELMVLPTYSGIVWADYMESIVGYFGREITKEAMVEMQHEMKPDITNPVMKKMLDKKQTSLLTKKIGYEDKPEYLDKFSGSIDLLNCYVMNKAMLQAYMDYGIKKVVFVAEEDEKTTKMCTSLSGQEFNIYDINEFERYSAVDEKIVTYRIKGLQVGVNMPPINNHFHYCRSTIMPVRNLNKN